MHIQFLVEWIPETDWIGYWDLIHSDGKGFILISGLLTQGTLVSEPSKNELSAFFQIYLIKAK